MDLAEKNISIRFYANLEAERVNEKYINWFCAIPKYTLDADVWFRCVSYRNRNNEEVCPNITRLENAPCLPEEHVTLVDTDSCLNSNFWMFYSTDKLVEIGIWPPHFSETANNRDIKEAEEVWDREEDKMEIDLSKLTEEQIQEVQKLVNHFETENKNSVVEQVVKSLDLDTPPAIIRDIAKKTIEVFVQNFREEYDKADSSFYGSVSRSQIEQILKKLS